MEVLIKKGHHYSNEFPRPLLYCNGIERYESRSYEFTDSCRYDTGVDQSDKNKLFGWSFGLHHTNSVRIGWCYCPDTDTIDLCLYLYINKQRFTCHICMVPIGKDIQISLFTYKNIKGDNTVYASVRYDNMAYSRHRFISNELPRWGYTLTSYFGGNRTAPHDITLDCIKNN